MKTMIWTVLFTLMSLAGCLEDTSEGTVSGVAEMAVDTMTDTAGIDAGLDSLTDSSTNECEVDGADCLYHGTTPGVCLDGACRPPCVDGSGCLGYTETSCQGDTLTTIESTCQEGYCVPADPTETECPAGCSEAGCLAEPTIFFTLNPASPSGTMKPEVMQEVLAFDVTNSLDKPVSARFLKFRVESTSQPWLDSLTPANADFTNSYGTVYDLDACWSINHGQEGVLRLEYDWVSCVYILAIVPGGQTEKYLLQLDTTGLQTGNSLVVTLEHDNVIIHKEGGPGYPPPEAVSGLPLQGNLLTYE